MTITLFDWINSNGIPLSALWDSLNLSILWNWLPSDVQTWIVVFLPLLFVLAVKRIIIN